MFCVLLTTKSRQKIIESIIKDKFKKDEYEICFLKDIKKTKNKEYDFVLLTSDINENYCIKSKINCNDLFTNYFKTKYFHPILYRNFTKKLLLFANTSIDISDGLISDLEKMINKQKLSYKIYLETIPISNNLKKLIDLKIANKISSITHGDDYQILFTASPLKSRIISKISKSLGIKISKIGKICAHSQKSQIIDEKNKKIALKNKGYFHKF